MTRAIPVQERATKRLDEINMHAAAVIATVGRDAFTTAQIAKAAGCSIGTFYRYYRSRVDVLDALYPKRTESLSPLTLTPERHADASIRFSRG